MDQKAGEYLHDLWRKNSSSTEPLSVPYPTMDPSAPGTIFDAAAKAIMIIA
jgi:hypothetical protein